MEELNILIEHADDGIYLRGSVFQELNDWKAFKFGPDRVLLDRSKSNSLQSLASELSAIGRFSNLSFVSLLQGLVQQEFTGMVAIEIGESLKRLYLKKGELVFAASNLMDDRLGEVIYRAGLITLEQLTDAAVQVNRTTKFGKVLIENGIFTSAQLWEALKLQVINIFESVFTVDELYVRLQEGEHLAPTAVSLPESTLVLIDEAQGYSAMLREFMQKLENDVQIEVNEEVFVRQQPTEGTFLRDTTDLIRQSSSVYGLVGNSKLSRINTLASLFDLVHRHLVRVRKYDTALRKIDRSGSYREIKSLLDAYHLILEGARKAFNDESLIFPVGDIEVFLEREYSRSRCPLFVQSDGAIAPEAVQGILTKSKVSARQGQTSARQLQGLILFLLQLVGDLLPNGKGWEIKRNFQNMIT